MITLNDYLYSGDTILRILYNYSGDLRNESSVSGNEIDKLHCVFLEQIRDVLEHNDFLTAQSQRIREFYCFMTKEYPYMAFNFKGRIKSLIRAEEKFNGYIVQYIYDYYIKNNSFPSNKEIKDKLNCFRDLIAYRIVIALPKCHVKDGMNKEEIELKYLYEIANHLPRFLNERGFRAEKSGIEEISSYEGLDEELKPYYRDYVSNPTDFGYRSLHITFYDEMAGCYVELQLRTKDMDDYAEIGPANHLGYEKRQELVRTKRDAVPVGKNIVFDEAYERVSRLQSLELKNLDVNMFAARDNSLINDSCGLFRGRQILPFEHLSRFQKELYD